MPILTANQPTNFFNCREQLPSIEDSLWLITSGVVKSYTIEDYNVITTLGFWGIQDVVGQCLSNIEPYILECLSDVEAIAIPQQQWSEVFSAIIHHGQQTEQFIYMMRASRVHKRLWLLLQWLGNKFGKRSETGRLIDFRLTHQELANTLGTTRITVTKILSRFEQEGLIFRPNKKSIVVNDLDLEIDLG
jgi:CRP-like cAMP-binding protein